MVWVLAKTDFKLRYHGSILGFFWVILKPLFQFLILNFVFSHIFQGGSEYSLGLFTGIILWSFFSEGTMVGITSIMSKAHIITKIAVPKWIVVFSSVLNTIFNYLLNIVILLLFFYFYGMFPSTLGILGLLYYSIMVSFIIFSVSFLLAPLYLKFRDINQIWDVFLMAGFYAAPIIYPITTLPENIRALLYLNPMTLPIVHVKEFLLHHQFSQGWHHLIFACIVLTLFVLSLIVFSFTSKRSAENV